MDLSSLLLYIPGIVIFLVGSARVRTWLSDIRSDGHAEATVTDCKHVVKKDRQGNEIFNYHNLTVEYVNPKTGNKETRALKSPSEFTVGQQVHLRLGTMGRGDTIMEMQKEPLIHPVITMICGALLILLALFTNQHQDVRAMVCLSLVLIGLGAGLLLNYGSLKKRGLTELDAVITDVYARQISKSTKIVKGEKFTYYPVVKYELNGVTNTRRCIVNSSSKKDFLIGNHLTLYLDEAKGEVVEKPARKTVLAAGIVVLAIGILSGLSILSVL